MTRLTLFLFCEMVGVPWIGLLVKYLAGTKYQISLGLLITNIMYNVAVHLSTKTVLHQIQLSFWQFLSLWNKKKLYWKSVEANLLLLKTWYMQSNWIGISIKQYWNRNSFSWPQECRDHIKVKETRIESKALEKLESVIGNYLPVCQSYTNSNVCLILGCTKLPF